MDNKEDNAFAKARAEREKASAEEAEKFRKELETPLDKDEAEKALANIEVQLAQLAVQRIRVVSQMDQAKQMLNQIDEQMGLAQVERQIIYRRTLNPVGETVAGE